MGKREKEIKKKKRKQKKRQTYNAMKKYSANNSWLITHENVKKPNRHKQK